MKTPSTTETYDCCVVGGTPGGIACAVRAAREGLRVLLVNHNRHLGGFMTSGAGGWEAPYDGIRSPLYGEMIQGAAAYYREKYGEGSPEHLAALPSRTSRRHIDRPKVEPSVAEHLFKQMVDKAGNLTVLVDYVVAGVHREGRLLRSAVFKPRAGGEEICVHASVFVEAMMEGDFAHAAGAQMRIGRESRETYDEPHAGVIYTRRRDKKPGQRGFPLDADEGRLDIRYNPYSSGEIVEGPQSGEADNSVMAYNYRFILTKAPGNRVPVPKPADTSTAGFSGKLKRSIVPNIPGGKVAWNGGGRLIGPQNEYPSADWPERERISRLYLDAALRELWLVQNAPGVDPEEREFWRDFGLAADEFSDNGNMPYEIYVREARRLVGRYVFTEHDNKPAPGLGRTPPHGDSIAITDWPLDSVACLDRSHDGSSKDGIFFLGEESRPAQIPYRCILPGEFDNLLVPVPLSASHVGWGAVRLEPVWMQTGEAAGFAAALAIAEGTTPGELDPDRLVRHLVKNGCITSFFNDAAGGPGWESIQYFGTKGFFADYHARPHDRISRRVARLWKEGADLLRDERLDPGLFALRVKEAEEDPEPELLEETRLEFLNNLRATQNG